MTVWLLRSTYAAIEFQTGDCEDGRMNQLLLLLHDEQQRCLLTNLLKTQYDVVLPDTGSQLLIKPFDVCLADLEGLNQHADEIRRTMTEARPLQIPVLVIVSPQDINVLPQDIVDDMVMTTTPVMEVEILIRLKALFRTRRLSLELMRNGQDLLRISKALASTSDAICIVDNSGRSIYHNPAFIDLYGFAVPTLNASGTLYSLFISPDGGLQVLQDAQRGQSWRGEVALRADTGKAVPTLLRVDPIEDDSGSQVGIINVCTDMSERIRIQAIEREQRILAESLRDTTAALTSTLDSDEVLDRILSNVGRVVPHDVANIMMVEDGSARIVRSRGYETVGIDDTSLLPQLQIEATPSLKWMWANGRSLAISDTTMQSTWQAAMQIPDLCSYAGSPIRLKGKIIGFLNLGSTTPGYFSPIHAERLQAFAEQAAIAIQNADLHEKAQMLAAVQERQRLARNLHDAVSQTLFSASVIAEALPRLWQRDPTKAWPRLAQLHRLTKGALAEMRNLLLELRPAALLDTDLDDLLHQLAAGMMGRARIDVELDIDPAKEIPAHVRIALYYVAQEALNNIIKHSRATHATIILRHHETGLKLDVSDNGCGFDVNRISPTSLGLGIMQERAQAIDASLEIVSVKGQGTSVKLDWCSQWVKDSSYECL